MRIAVIGTGKIGGTLAGRWIEAGHEVVYGGREPGGDGPGGAPILDISLALDGADVVLLAIPGPAVAGVVTAHTTGLAGKVIIDATNTLGGSQFNRRADIQKAAPDAWYVRAFNTLGWENFASPVPGSALFFAADPDARAAAEQLISDVGLEPVYVGDAGQAGTVDGLLPLWFALAMQRRNRKLAFGLVTG
jgi:predicted dinucleotide-binding enzyme